MEEITNKIVRILGDSGHAATADSNLKEDLSLDSLDIVEFGINLEREFKINISDQKLDDIKTVSDAAKLVQELTK